MVVSVTVCAVEGLGGAVKVRVAGFKLNVEGAAVTFSVTTATTGAAIPLTVIDTDET